MGSVGPGPVPDPVFGSVGPEPDPDPVPVGSSPPQVQDEILTFPLAALASITPHPSIGTALAVPEHFLSQVILDLAHEPFAHLQSTSHLHFFLPNGIVTAARFATLALLPATGVPGAGMPGTMASRKSGTHWHPSPPWLILSWTVLVMGIIMSGHTAIIMSGHIPPSIMGHTLVKPLPQ